MMRVKDACRGENVSCIGSNRFENVFKGTQKWLVMDSQLSETK
jgi:hypothetical protein